MKHVQSYTKFINESVLNEGTSGIIAMRTLKGIVATRVNWDAYPDGVGKELYKNYNTPPEIEELITKGEIRTLAGGLEYYDEGSFEPTEYDTIEDAEKDISGEFIYLYDPEMGEDGWVVKSTGEEEFIDLGAAIKHGVNEDFDQERRSNDIPEGSNWTEFMKFWDIGVMDMDNIASKMGYDDLEDLDISVSPRSIIFDESDTGPGELAAALKAYTTKAYRKSVEEIEEINNDEAEKGTFGWKDPSIKEEPRDEEEWTDPAGGTHQGGPEDGYDPASMYEEVIRDTPEAKKDFIIQLHDNADFYKENEHLFDELYRMAKETAPDQEDIGEFLDILDDDQINQIYMRWHEAYGSGDRTTNKYEGTKQYDDVVTPQFEGNHIKTFKQLFEGEANPRTPESWRSKEGGQAYWNKKGRYQKQYDELYKKLVPAEGEAPTEHGEVLRSISRIYYDYYNNGFANITSEYYKDLIGNIDSKANEIQAEMENPDALTWWQKGMDDVVEEMERDDDDGYDDHWTDGEEDWMDGEDQDESRVIKEDMDLDMFPLMIQGQNFDVIMDELVDGIVKYVARTDGMEI